MKNFKEEIEKEVRKVFYIGLESGNANSPTKDYPVDATVDEIASLFRQAMDEVIGIDVETKEKYPTRLKIKIIERNQLRAEQRERANKLMKKE